MRLSEHDRELVVKALRHSLGSRLAKSTKVGLEELMVRFIDVRRGRPIKNVSGNAVAPPSASGKTAAASAAHLPAAQTPG